MRPSTRTTSAALAAMPLTFPEARAAHEAGIKAFGRCIFKEMPGGSYCLFLNQGRRSRVMYQPNGLVKLKQPPSAEFPDGVDIVLKYPAVH